MTVDTKKAQFTALLYKNYKLLLRRWKSLVVVVLTPFIALFVALIVNSVSTASIPDAPEIWTPEYTKPHAALFSGMVWQQTIPIRTAAYISGEYMTVETTDKVMKHAAQKLGFEDSEFDKYFERYQSVKDYAEFIQKNNAAGGDAFEFLVIFNNSAVIGNPMNMSVFLYTNVTVQKAYQSHQVDALFDDTLNGEMTEQLRVSSSRALAMQIAVEEGLTIHLLNIPTAKFTYKMHRFVDEAHVGQTQSSSKWKQALITTWGGLFYQLIIISYFMVVIGGLTEEKMIGLKNKLGVMGLWEGLYIGSWAVFEIPKALVSCLLFLIPAVFTPLYFFSRTNFFVLVFLFFGAFCAFFGMACFIASISRQSQLAGYIVGMLILMIGLVFELAISIVGETTKGYGKGQAQYSSFYMYLVRSSTTKFGQTIFYLFPPINIGCAVGAIQTIVSDWAEGSGQVFTWSHITAEILTIPTGGKTASVPTGRSLSFFITALYVDCLVYLVLAWYFGHIFAGKTGNSVRPWFPCMPTFWIPRSRRRQDNGPVDTVSKKRTQSELEHSIVLHKLSKVFKNKNALKELSMDVKFGEVFCLLGHNGAGKTTTINILTGIHQPTHGKAFVFGQDTASDMAELRQCFGICEQEDVLLKELSGYEHAFFFAMFRGSSPTDAKERAWQELQEVQLTGAAHQPSATYSGGMKRRLCVANACVSKPEVLFLDEPTTGMDPISKKYVWEKILEYKKNHIVILTTHSMQEADVLSDNVAILAGGRLRAHGSALFLKNRFGIGYKLHCICAEGVSHPLVEEIQQRNAKIDVFAHNVEDVTLRIPRKERHCIPGVINVISQQGENIHDWGLSNTTLEEVFLKVAVDAKSVNAGAAEEKNEKCKLCNKNLGELVTLFTNKCAPVEVGDVVCRWCSEEFDPANPELPPGVDDDEKMFAEVDSWKPVAPPPMEQQYVVPMKVVEVPEPTRIGGIFGMMRYKSLPRLAKQRKSLICVIIFQIILLVVVILMGFFASFLGSEYDLKGCNFALDRWQDSDGCSAPPLKEGGCPVSFIESIIEKGFTGGHPYLGSSNDHCGNYRVPYTQPWRPPNSVNPYNGLGHVGYPKLQQSGWPMYTWIGGATPTQFKNLQDLWPTVNSSTFQGNPSPVLMSEAWGWTSNQTVPNCNTFECMKSQISTNQKARKEEWFIPALNVSNGIYPSTAVNPTITKFSKAFPYNSVAFHQLDETTAVVDATISAWLMANPNRIGYKRWSPPTGPSYDCPPYFFPTFLEDPPPFGYTYLFINRTNGGSLPLDYFNPMYWSYTSWYCTWNSGDKSAEQAMYLQSTITDILWRQKDPNARITTYHLSQPPVKIQVSKVSNIAVVVTAALMPIGLQVLLPLFVSEIAEDIQTKSITLTKIVGLSAWQYWTALWGFCMLLEVLVAILYAAAVVGLGLLPTSTLPVLVLLLLCYGHCTVGIATFLAGIIPRPTVALILSFVWAVIAGPALSMATWVGVQQSDTSSLTVVAYLLPPMALSDTFLQMAIGHAGGRQVVASVIVFAVGTVLLIIGTLVYGLRTGVLSEWTKFGRPQLKDAKYETLTSHEGGDEDVRAMTQEVEELVGNRREGEKGLVITRLVKAYPKGRRADAARVAGDEFLAVKGVSWYANPGECFGLLGPNGAGKSTTMHMLEGSILPTAGKMTVNGVDTLENPDEVCRMLGVCQQEDILWSDLSVKDHLRVYATIKGVRRKDLDTHVQHIAEVVRLDGDEFNQKASELSGGMKRRLCIGIALTGNPSVILLDEPTTGLDPESRRVVWDVINACKAEKCVVLTTHSMEEADALCSRIGIMNDGKMQCIGAQLHLKRKFGSGYKLTITVKSDDQAHSNMEYCTRTLREIVGDALTVYNQVSLTTEYNITGHNIDVAGIFRAMDGQDIRKIIADWGFCMCSLDDVFVRVCETGAK